MSNVLKDLGHFVNNLIMKIYFKKSNSKQSLTVCGTWTLKNLDHEKHRKKLDSEKTLEDHIAKID